MQNQQAFQEMIRWKDQEIQNLNKEIEILNRRIEVIQNYAHCQIYTAQNIQSNQQEGKIVQLEIENIKLKQQVKQLQLDLNTLQQQLNLSQQNNNQSNQENKQIINNGFNKTIYVSIQQSQSI